MWKAHGDAVAATKPYLPGSFDWPPRNPAEKINNGFKAWEFLIYIYGLGPGLFYGVLPSTYWENFCKLVYGIWIIHQHKIAACDLCQAHKALNEFAIEFKKLYYWHHTDHLHFVQPVLHRILHLAPEVTCIGPGLCVSQWTMEQTIGNLGEEIWQPSNPYANLSQHRLHCCRVNALKAIFPDLEPTKNNLLRGAVDLSNNQILLRAMENLSLMHPQEAAALWDYLQESGGSMDDGWCPSVQRWAHLQLLNGQIAHSVWKENLKPLNKVHMAQNVKVYLSLYCISVIWLT